VRVYVRGPPCKCRVSVWRCAADPAEVFGNTAPQEVNVVKLDDVVKYRVNFLIVDTQGFDHHVLLGAQKLMEDYGVDIVLFEYGPTLLKKAGGDPAGVLKFMHSMGYACFDTETLNKPLNYGSGPSQWRTFDRFPTLFQTYLFMNKEHGTWTNILCFSP
jgi:hypothetical protein